MLGGVSMPPPGQKSATVMWLALTVPRAMVQIIEVEVREPTRLRILTS
jgi:hypothetical protein